MDFAIDSRDMGAVGMAGAEREFSGAVDALPKGVEGQVAWIEPVDAGLVDFHHEQRVLRTVAEFVE